MVVTFEWDPDKARSNYLKHGIEFRQAKRVFRDPWLMDHPRETFTHEHRLHVIGLAVGKELFVAFTLRNSAIRLISAREATNHERKKYWSNRYLCHA